MSRTRPIRRALFWVHLASGLGAGLVIALLAVTGTLLTYERQIVDAAERAAWPEAPDSAPDDSSTGAWGDDRRMSLDALVEAARDDGFDPVSVTVRPEPAAPVIVSAGRRDHRALDPWSGEARPPAAEGLQAFFGLVTRVHRWFALEGDAREAGRRVTATANLVFLLLAVSGLVLWWPILLARPMFRIRVWFSTHYPTSRARDHAWHHVLGIWCVLPFLAITSTGAVIYFDWAKDLVNDLAGDPSTLRTAPRDPAPSEGNDAKAAPPPSVDLQQVFETVRSRAGDWRQITLPVSADPGGRLDLTIDRGTGAQIQHQETLTVDAGSGAVLGAAPRFAEAPGRRARIFLRYLHTGEVFGIVGQTIAGVASAAAALLVWTGFALAWRRLVQPALRRRRARADAAASGRPAAP